MRNIKLLACVTLIFTIVLLSSCKKHNDVVAKPVIGAQNANDTTTIGQTLILHPGLTGPVTGLSFNWTVNGTQAGTDSVYSFVPATRGDFQLVFTATNPGGSTSTTYKVHVYGKYENGFFLVNEGWYGHGSGTLGFYRYDTHALEDSVYTKENPGADLGPITSTMEFGTIYNNKLYLLTKVGGPLIVADAYSLKESGRIASNAGNDFRAFVPIDTTKALISTGTGIYPLNLQTMTLGPALPSVTGEADDMIKAGNYIFVLDGNGLDILNASDYSVAKNLSNVTVGFTQAMDGSIWAAGSARDVNYNILDSNLVKIDPSTLDTTNVHLPFEINGTLGFWHPGSMTASTTENAVFIGYNTSFGGATTIYKYSIGNAASVSVPWLNVPPGKELYGQGIAYDQSRNQLILTTVYSGYGANYANNDLYMFGATTGAIARDLSYMGYYFPARPVFH
jgi:uncharacterized protein DUF5074